MPKKPKKQIIAEQQHEIVEKNITWDEEDVPVKMELPKHDTQLEEDDEDDEDDELLEDMFVVACSDFGLEDIVEAVRLPKFSMENNRLDTYSPFMLIISGDKADNYKKVFNILAKGGRLKDFSVSIVQSQETNDEAAVLATFKTVNPQIVNVDFGKLARLREDERNFLIEVDCDEIYFNETNKLTVGGLSANSQSHSPKGMV